MSREKLEGSGEIIVVREEAESGAQLAPKGIIKIGNSWFWAIGLIRKPSLIALIRKILGQTTTTKFRNFLLVFGLNIQDLFDDNPEETTEYIKGICDELINGSSPKNVHSHTLRNLKEWLVSLKPGHADQLRRILQETILTLENLLDGEEQPEKQIAAEALRKMTGSQ